MPDARMMTFPQNTVILREGELNEDMYKIVKGHAEIYVGYGTEHETLLGVIGDRSCFGEFGLLLKKPAIYTVIAYDDILALKITEGDMGDFIKENHGYIMDIMRNMANSMMTMRFQIDLLTKELEHGRKENDEEMKEKIRQARQIMKQYAVCNQRYMQGMLPGNGSGIDRKA